MKANKRTLMAIKRCFENDACFDVDEFIDDLVNETGTLKCEKNGRHDACAGRMHPVGR